MIFIVALSTVRIGQAKEKVRIGDKQSGPLARGPLFAAFSRSDPKSQSGDGRLLLFTGSVVPLAPPAIV
jgi:hypothetical protein